MKMLLLEKIEQLKHLGWVALGAFDRHEDEQSRLVLGWMHNLATDIANDCLDAERAARLPPNKTP